MAAAKEDLQNQENGVSHSNRSLHALPSSEYTEEVYTVLLVTCYSEDQDGIKTTLDSLASTIYNDSKKLIFIVADGQITGAGNLKSTPELILELLEIDESWSSEPVSYQAISEGSKKHNMARVYAGFYRCDDHCVPILFVSKCGTPDETGAKPGNRGKRDSQIILMSFFKKVTFDEPMSPLEYDMFSKIVHLMNVTPDRFEIILMVDADTRVEPDSLSRMVAVMVEDPLVIGTPILFVNCRGLCGETRIMNKSESWVTRIQVFEYYLSHHLQKTFESMFGSVTCLPGCFCMWRIKSKKGNGHWVPILANPDIVETYSEPMVDTLHKKNLLLLGEDRFLTTIMLRTFPRRKTMFIPAAFCKTTVPDTFAILLSQRRRWYI
jgi:chitin synthase